MHAIMPCESFNIQLPCENFNLQLSVQNFFRCFGVYEGCLCRNANQPLVLVRVVFHDGDLR